MLRISLLAVAGALTLTCSALAQPCGQNNYGQSPPPGHYYCGQHAQYCNHGQYYNGNNGYNWAVTVPSNNNNGNCNRGNNNYGWNNNNYNYNYANNNGRHNGWGQSRHNRRYNNNNSCQSNSYQGYGAPNGHYFCNSHRQYCNHR